MKYFFYLSVAILVLQLTGSCAKAEKVISISSKRWVVTSSSNTTTLNVNDTIDFMDNRLVFLYPSGGGNRVEGFWDVYLEGTNYNNVTYSMNLSLNNLSGEYEVIEEGNTMTLKYQYYSSIYYDYTLTQLGN